MKGNLLLTALFLVLSLAVACTGAATTPAATAPSSPQRAAEPRADWQVKWDQVVAGAKKEGEMMIYAAVAPETLREVTTAIRNKYGIEVSFVTTGRGSEVAERVLRERNAGLYVVDALMPGVTTLVSNIKPAGILEAIDSIVILPEVLDPKAWRGGTPFLDKEHKIIPIGGAFNRYIFRNTKLVRDGEIKSYQDLLDPKWKGKIIINDPTQSGAGNSWIGLMVRTWGLENTKEYLRQFVKQEPVITRDIRLHLETVSREKYALGIGPNVALMGEFINLGAPLALVRTVEGGNIAGSVGLSVPKNPAHPNASALFTNWLLTREGMEVFMKGFRAPVVRADVDFKGISPIFLPEPGETVNIDDEESILLKGTVLLDVAKEAFAPLFR